MPKTVKVRVLVVVDHKGQFASCTYPNTKIDELQGTLYDMVDGDNLQFHWLTAELPIPETLEIEAEAEPGPAPL